MKQILAGETIAGKNVSTGQGEEQGEGKWFRNKVMKRIRRDKRISSGFAIYVVQSSHIFVLYHNFVLRVSLSRMSSLKLSCVLGTIADECRADVAGPSAAVYVTPDHSLGLDDETTLWLDRVYPDFKQRVSRRWKGVAEQLTAYSPPEVFEVRDKLPEGDGYETGK